MGCGFNEFNGIDNQKQNPLQGRNNQWKVMLLVFNSIDINECANAPCLNGADCVDTNGSFVCICPEGFNGTLCENGELF